MKKIIYTVIFLIGLIAFFVFGKTLYDIHKNANDYTFTENIVMPSTEALEHFSGGLKIRTVSNPKYDETDFAQFDEFIGYLQKTYPLIFQNCKFDLVNKYGIVLKYDGKDKSKLPNILTAHYDVVGVKNENNSKYPPFSGHFDEEYIYSRGTIDDKGSVFAILESLNDLIKEGFRPEADLYIAFSQTEETGSPEGALKIIEYFKNNNIKFDTALDEGGRIVDKSGNYYAFIGTGEKGRLLTKITVFGTGSHASYPSDNSAVYKLSKLIQAFHSNPLKPVLSKDIEEYYLRTYNSYDFYTKLLISNRHLLKPLLIKHLQKDSEDNARIRSTFAITILEASNIQNAVSNDASMLIDTRILPVQNTEFIKENINKIVKKTLPKENVKIEYLTFMEPSKTSDIATDEFHKLTENIQGIYPGVTVAPYLTLGATDAREYSEISDNTYRFLPCILTDEESALMHADNEQISVKNWGRMITFYKTFIKSR